MQGLSVTLTLSLNIWIYLCVSEGHANSGCAPCGRHVTCPELVNFRDCELVRRPCGCCDECARQMGEYCSAYSPRLAFSVSDDMQDLTQDMCTNLPLHEHLGINFQKEKYHRCERGLMCMNNKGETLERVPWIMKKYHGICQNVVVQPVVEENYNVDDRRIGSRHEKNRV